jgi:hypothetical protein
MPRESVVVAKPDSASVANSTAGALFNASVDAVALAIV